MTHTQRLWVTGLLLLAGGCRSTASTGTSSAEAASPSQPIEEGAVRIAPESRPSLDIQPAGSGAAIAVVRAPGRVAFRDGAVAQVAAPIVGRVAEIHVKVGDPVKAGDALVTLHSPAAAAAARADLESALVSLKAARAVLERQTAMLQKGVGIESEKFQAEIDVAKVESDVARAQRAVAYLGQGAGSTVVVRAPIAGTVLQRRTTLGAVADPNGEALIELGDSRATWIVADVFERDLPLVAAGAGASVALAGVPQPVRGRVVSVGATLTSGMRTAPVYVALDDAAVAPRAGMYARVTLDAQALDGVTLPVNAVLIKDGKTSVVYVQRDELTFLRREVSVGQPIDGRVQVLSGVAPGDRVVVRGALLLDGAADQLL
ncbi:efflux RND transporter periplasmic adaptor subunit [Sorangium sp. So ce315]|uniref:efflux RND transporter periplasmic adaptor subunit n=1 Tax=Sorangium sp. So ce315 TaxID=3133299 RepID=UPI003F5D5915